MSKQLPKRNCLTIAEVAGKLRVPLEDVELYLMTGDLRASIRLQHPVQLCFTEFDYNDEGKIEDATHYLQQRSGEFEIVNYKNIRWGADDTCELMGAGIVLFQGRRSRGLTVSNGSDYEFAERYIIRRSEIFIDLASFNDFLALYGLDQREKIASICAKQLADVRNAPNKKRREEIAAEINRRVREAVDVAVDEIRTKRIQCKLTVNHIAFWNDIKTERNLDDKDKDAVMKIVKVYITQELKLPYWGHRPGKDLPHIIKE